MEQPHAAALAEAGAGADEYRIRPLELADLSKGFCELLSQLSPFPPLTEDAFRSRFAELAALGPNHLILVAEDAATGHLTAAGAVLVERKFIRRCGSVGHVEDVVVDAAARGRGLGERVVRRLVEHAKGRGCYKVILNCTPELRGFYSECGFLKKNVQATLLYGIQRARLTGKGIIMERKMPYFGSVMVGARVRSSSYHGIHESRLSCQESGPFHMENPHGGGIIDDCAGTALPAFG